MLASQFTMTKLGSDKGNSNSLCSRRQGHIEKNDMTCLGKFIVICKRMRLQLDAIVANEIFFFFFFHQSCTCSRLAAQCQSAP